MTQERLSVRTIREILRLKYESKLSNRAIARACRVSNSTVGEYLARVERAGVTWPLDENWSETELYEKLFPGEEKTAVVSERPVPNWEEVHRELSRQGVTLMLLWQEYRVQHPDGYGRTQFFEHYHTWNQTHTASMRLPHKGGEEMEVDYAGMTLPITHPESGEVTQAQIFVSVLPASNYTYVEVQPSQELQYWLMGHVHAFQFYGVPKILRPDNLKSGVKKPNYYEPDLNPSYQELAEHYHVAVLPARVKRPKDKSHVENGVQNVERWILAVLRNQTFFSVAEANRAIAPLRDELNQKEMQHLGKSRKQLFEEVDRDALLPLPERAYEFARWKNARVSIDYHVAFEGHYYSVPHTLVGQEVRLRATEHLLQVFHREKQIAIHSLSDAQGRFSTNPDHMPSHHKFVLNTDSDWLLREAAKVGPHTAAYMTAVLRSRPFPQQSFRTCLGILNLARKFLPSHMEVACQRLLNPKLLTYQDLKSELEHLPIDPSLPVLPAHDHVRGDQYYQ